MKRFVIIAALALGVIGCTNCVKPELEPYEVTMLNSQCVVIGHLVGFKGGIATMRHPPTTNISIELSNPKTLSGSFKGDRFTLQLEGYDWAKALTIGGDYVFGGAELEGQFVATKLFRINEKQSETLVDLFKCQMTMPAGVVFTVEQIKSKNEKKYQNPYGDGLFKVTLENTTHDTVKIPAVLNEDGSINWEKSVSIICEDRVVNAAEETSSFKLAPKSKVVGEINTLKLNGINWPNGGSRIYFVFNMNGEKAYNFFYYYSAIHDAMRKAQEK